MKEHAYHVNRSKFPTGCSPSDLQQPNSNQKPTKHSFLFGEMNKQLLKSLWQLKSCRTRVRKAFCKDTAVRQRAADRGTQ